MTTPSLRWLLLAGLPLAALTAVPAHAQIAMYPGEDVSVNLSAIPAASGRGVHALPPVHLHRPRHHAAKIAQPAPEAAPSAPLAAAPETEAAPPPPKASRRKHAPAPAPAAPPPAAPAPGNPPPGGAAIPFSFGGEAPATPPAAPSSAPPPPHEPRANIKAPEKGLSKQAAVLFDAGSFALSDNATATLNDLAFSLKTALVSGGSRVELVGFGGAPGDSSSNARRLSLERALAVRQALIVNGVPADRIDVRALGGVTDNGATDRVDVFVKA